MPTPTKRLTIKDLQTTARKRGGECLSESYLGLKAKHRWRCAQGHEWEATAKAVRKGSWCHVCNGGIQRQIEDLQTTARARGGECLSPAYTNCTAKYRWRCAQGHEWEATAGNVLYGGSWCRVCAAVKLSLGITDLQARAHERGGECLSHAYTNCTAKYRWRCAQGHEWEATAAHVLHGGGWCPVCAAGKFSLGIIDLQATARERGGECLSESYLGLKVKYRWRCAQGHEWEATAVAVRGGSSWCPVCAANKLSLGITDLQATARERGGECLSHAYTNCSAKYRWRCAQGHQWKATARSIRYGSWCPICAAVKLSLGITDLQATARERGGECLSESYLGLKAKYRWRCAQGHEWETTAVAVRGGSSWCPVCAADKLSLGITDLQALARKRGGECLSESYLGLKAKHRWRCAQGHEWETTPSQIRRGSWCPVCGNRKRGRPKRFDDLQAMAHQRGGICLNEVCLGSSSLHTWRCAEGHEWEATPYQIRRGSWCPVCAAVKLSLGITDLQALARKRGGECLSESYLGLKVKHRWRCAQGHEWETTAANVLYGGFWCRVCAAVKLSLGVTELQARARERGGEFLSPAYTNCSAKYRWRCAQGHEWEATAANVLYRGYWCPVCTNRKRGRPKRFDDGVVSPHPRNLSNSE